MNINTATITEEQANELNQIAILLERDQMYAANTAKLTEVMYSLRRAGCADLWDELQRRMWSAVGPERQAALLAEYEQKGNQS